MVDLEQLRAPSGLCGAHRLIWKRCKARGFHALSDRIARKCQSGTAELCSTRWESQR